MSSSKNENTTTGKQEDGLEEIMRKLKKGTRVGEVDKDKTIGLIYDAIGSRSKRQFAKILGKNVATISRISTGKTTEIGNDILAKIAYYADPDSGVTIEKLMEAQGIVEVKDRKGMGLRHEEECRRIIADTLLNHGHSVTYITGKNARTNYDIEIITDALNKKEGRWLIDVKMMTAYARQPVGMEKAMAWIDKAMAAYYMGEKADRISLVVDHPIVFEKLKECLSQFVIPDEISVILISTMKGKILDEYVAPLADGQTPVYLLTDEEETE